jgi:hypothetical protein
MWRGPESIRSDGVAEPAGLSPNVVVLGLVSLLMGMSSAMIYGLLPVFLVTVVGTSTASVGLIEGIAEATARSPARHGIWNLRYGGRRGDLCRQRRRRCALDARRSRRFLCRRRSHRCGSGWYCVLSALAETGRLMIDSRPFGRNRRLTVAAATPAGP